jgi:hypothetical protein
MDDACSGLHFTKHANSLKCWTEHKSTSNSLAQSLGQEERPIIGAKGGHKDTGPPSDISWIGSIQIFLLFFIGTFSGRATDAGYFRFTLPQDRGQFHAVEQSMSKQEQVLDRT